MKAAIATFCILVFLAVNHAFYGDGCWGAQPGGGWSSLLFTAQLIVVAITVMWIVYSIMHRRYSRVVFVSLATILCVSIVSFLFYTLGWRVFTTIHNQGSENLTPFVGTSLIAILLAFIGHRHISRPRTCRSLK